MKNRAEPSPGGAPTGRRPDTVFWVEPDAVSADRLVLGPDETRHLLHVHRASLGAPFTAVDGEGGVYDCVLDAEAGDRAVGRIRERHRDRGELPAPIRLIAGLGDPASAEAVVDLAVPLGVVEIDLPACARTGRPPLEPKRIERLLRLAKAAVKQSQRSRLPSIRSSPSLAASLGSLGPGARLLADAAGGRLSADSTVGPKTAVTIAVGPPGGFDGDESRLLIDLGFSPISLGPSRLRTEQAAAALLSIARNTLFYNILSDV
jgi:16S rRNA (uracil1498-N3)-methyltransferase